MDRIAELEAQLDAEREKVAFVEKTAADFQALWRTACDQRESFETQLTQLQALVRAIYQDLPTKRDWLDPVLEARMKATLDATPTEKGQE